MGALEELSFPEKFDVILSDRPFGQAAQAGESLQRVREGLKSEGMFAFFEDVGAPTPSASLTSWIHRALALLPHGLAEGDAGAGRSAGGGRDLLLRAPQLFHALETRAAGGGLLTRLDGSFPFRRSDEDPIVRDWLDLLITLEELLLRQPEIESQLVLWVGRK